jgi:microcystin-dependent protein
MTTPYVGEIRLFPYNFAPVSWLDCDGSLLPVANYEVLFALLGTTYGGDGQTTFGIPDMRGRAPLHMGTGTGLTARPLGQMAGSETVTLTAQQMPAHYHLWTASNATATTGTPSSSVQLAAVTGTNTAYASDVSGITPVSEAAASGGFSGGGGAHQNMMPTTALRYCIATVGVFPTQS